MRDWRSALQSKSMKHVAIGLLFLNVAGVYAVHLKVHQPVPDEIVFADTPAVVAYVTPESDDIAPDFASSPSPKPFSPTFASNINEPAAVPIQDRQVFADEDAAVSERTVLAEDDAAPARATPSRARPVRLALMRPISPPRHRDEFKAAFADAALSSSAAAPTGAAADAALADTVEIVGADELRSHDEALGELGQMSSEVVSTGQASAAGSPAAEDNSAPSPSSAAMVGAPAGELSPATAATSG